MTTSFTYATLKQAIYDYTEDDGDEITRNIDIIIGTGLDRLVRDLNFDIFKQTFTGTMTLNNPELNKPSSMLSVETFVYISSNVRYFLKERSVGFCNLYWPNRMLTGAPKFWAHEDPDSFLISPTPQSGYSYEIRGLVQLALNASNTSNWLSTNSGDLLLYSCLIAAEQFLMEHLAGRPTEWQGEYIRMLPIEKARLQSLARKSYEDAKLQPVGEVQEANQVQ